MDRVLDQWLGGWRAIVLAALICGAVALPGLGRLPVIDRGEASFAEGTAQMVEQGDFTVIRYQQRLRGGTAPAAHWAQAASVGAFSRPEDRAVWAWRLPSVVGLMLAAASTAWGAGALFARRCALPAGLICGGSLLVSTLGGVATAEALFVGFTALSLAAFGKLYLGTGAVWSRIALWIGLIGASLVEGPTAPAIAILAGAVLFAADHRADWLGRLGLPWGLIALAAAALPWVTAVTVATDGAFWHPEASSPASPLWLGAQTLTLPLMLFPATALLPAAVAYAWRRRAEPAVRVTLAWTLPAGLLFELLPDRQIVDQAPLIAGLAWLAAAALFERPSPWVRWLGAALALLAGCIMAALCLGLAHRFGSGAAVPQAGLIALLFATAGGLSALAVLRGWGITPFATALGLGMAGRLLLVAVLAPGLAPLWPAVGVMTALAQHSLDPRQGIAIGPVASAGFAEPSLVFALGPETQTGAAADAVQAIAEQRPALVEDREAQAFRTALAVQTVEGYDYVEGRPVRITLYRSANSNLPSK